MSLSETLRGWLLAPVIQKLEEIQNTMTSDQAALDSAIKAVGVLITSEDTGIVAIIDAVNALIAKVQANPTSDFTTEVTALNSMAADITTQAANIQAALASSKPITG